MIVKIDRAKWNTGSRITEPGLYNPPHEPCDEHDQPAHDECYCCLGFLSAACGVPVDAMRNAGVPSDLLEVDDRYQSLPTRLFEVSPFVEQSEDETELWERAFAELNDAEGVDHATRESWIAEGFKTILGCDVEFVGEYTEDS